MAAAEARPFVTSEEVARLVHHWLAQQHLHRTAATLADEGAALLRVVDGAPRSLQAILSEYVVLKAQGPAERSAARGPGPVQRARPLLTCTPVRGRHVSSYGSVPRAQPRTGSLRSPPSGCHRRWTTLPRS